MSDASKVIDPEETQGLTGAGRAFQKHASRTGGDVLWGIIKGGPKVLNMKGQDFVDSIVYGSDTNWSIEESDQIWDRYKGPLLQGTGPDGRGARWLMFDLSKFVGFTNP